MEQAARQFFRFLVAIFDVCIAIPLLWYFIGWQALMGIIFLFLLVPFGGFLSYLSGKLRLKTAVISDRRINLMTEIVAGIREVKTHAWEWFFRDKIKETRRLVEQDCRVSSCCRVNHVLNVWDRTSSADTCKTRTGKIPSKLI